MPNKYYFAFVIFLIIFDQVSKYLIHHNFNLSESITIFNWLNFTYAQNNGAAFSLGANWSFSRYLLPFISIIASIIISIWITKIKPTNILKLFALSFILAGAFGNFIDRALFGYVIDFIHLTIDFWGYTFAIFNLADSFISIGVALLLFSSDD